MKAKTIVGSESYSLSKEDWKKIGMGALIAIAGALATWMQEVIPGVNFGSYTTFMIIVNSVLVNIIRKFVSDNS